MTATLRRRRADGRAVCEELGSAGKRPRLRLKAEELNTALQLTFDKCLNIADLLRVETVNRDWRFLAFRSLRLQKKVDLKKLFLPHLMPNRRAKEHQRFCSMLEWLWHHCPNVRELMQLSEVLQYLSGSCRSYRTVFMWSSRIGLVISRFTKLDNFRIAMHVELKEFQDYQSAYKHAQIECDVAGALGKATRLESVELTFPDAKSAYDMLGALKTDRLLRLHVDFGPRMFRDTPSGAKLQEFNDRLRAFLLSCPLIETLLLGPTLRNRGAFQLQERAALLAAKPRIQIIEASS